MPWTGEGCGIKTGKKLRKIVKTLDDSIGVKL